MLPMYTTFLVQKQHKTSLPWVFHHLLFPVCPKWTKIYLFTIFFQFSKKKKKKQNTNLFVWSAQVSFAWWTRSVWCLRPRMPRSSRRSKTTSRIPRLGWLFCALLLLCVFFFWGGGGCFSVFFCKSKFGPAGLRNLWTLFVFRVPSISNLPNTRTKCLEEGIKYQETISTFST